MEPAPRNPVLRLLTVRAPIVKEAATGTWISPVRTREEAVREDVVSVPVESVLKVATLPVILEMRREPFGFSIAAEPSVKEEAEAALRLPRTVRVLVVMALEA